MEIDNLLGEVELALPSLADRTTRSIEKQIEKLLRRIEKRHRFIADQNVSHFFSLVENAEDRKARYHEYMVDEVNHMLKEWQSEDRRSLGELLATLIAEDMRLQGYFEIGSRFGEAVDDMKRASGTLTKKDRAYVLAGMKKLSLREQKEIEPFFMPTSPSLILHGKRIEKLGRFLIDHDDDLTAKPKWDGKTISYRRQTEDVRIQKKSVMTTILDEAEAQGWPDSIRLSEKQVGNKRSVSNAICYFQCEHKLVDFTINGDRIMWGPPGTVKPKRKRSTRSV